MAHVYDVAQYITRKVPLSERTKLLKLAYYAQAWHLVWHGTPLFSSKIEAWEHGPVIPDLWAELKYNQGQDLPSEPDLTETETATIDAVLDHYSQLGANELSRLSHAEEPWKRAREGYGDDARSREVIRDGVIRKFYTTERLKGNGPTYRGSTKLPTSEELLAAMPYVLKRWAKTFELLADR